jgi:hypothetical protein
MGMVGLGQLVLDDDHCPICHVPADQIKGVSADRMLGAGKFEFNADRLASRAAFSSSHSVKFSASCRHTDRGSTCSRRPNAEPLPVGLCSAGGIAADGTAS